MTIRAIPRGAIILAIFSFFQASAAILYVDLNSANPLPPYTTWDTAATNIQDAIDAASPGDQILVTNGIYATGGRPVNGFLLTNRVAVTKPVIVQSVNGPAVTLIQGYPVLGNTAVRCVYLTNNAQLIGFTLTNGATETVSFPDEEIGGGGVFCESSNCLVSNCVMSVNSAANFGGAAYSGTLESCLLSSNTAPEGGGAISSVLVNSTLTGNSSPEAGGAVTYCLLTNCTLSFNRVTFDGGAANGSTLYGCLLSSNSAIDGGGAYACTLNGCTLSGNFSTSEAGGAYGGTLIGCTLSNNLSGGDGGGVVDAALTNCTLSGNSATNGNGGGAGQLSSSANCVLDHCTLAGNYASNNGGGANDSILVSCTLSNNQAGSSGGGSSSGYLSYCVLTGNSAVNGGGASSGFLTNCTLSGNSADLGGGDYQCIRLSQCQLISNTATDGGGDFGGYLNNCSLQNNIALNQGGGSSGGSLVDCQISSNSAASGGGVYGGGVSDCLIVSNSANLGGGAYNVLTVNCTVVSNTASQGGGIYSDGFDFITSANSIVMLNSAGQDPNFSNPSNNVIAFNHCFTLPMPSTSSGGGNNYTNDPVLTTDGNFRLQSNSPCINSGINSGTGGLTNDLDGNPRIVGGTVDVGAYEYQTPLSRISYAWLEQYGLPITTNIDTTDSDGTGMDNWQKWIAGLNPTNSASVFVMLPPATTNTIKGLIISWESVSNRSYFLQRARNLATSNAFSTIRSNLFFGLTGTATIIDATATNGGPFFYRVGVTQ